MSSTGLTDGRGRFRCTRLPAGTVTVSARRSGAPAVERELRVGSGESALVELVLQD